MVRELEEPVGVTSEVVVDDDASACGHRRLQTLAGRG